MLIYKIIFLASAILYSIYLYQYSKWEKIANKNSLGSFLIKLFIILDLGVLALSFFDKIYYTS